MKSIMRLISLTLCGVALTACSTQHSTTHESTDTQELETLNLTLDWYPNANHIPIYTALNEGFFEEEGLNVVIHMPAEVDDPIRLTGANQTDVAISYPGVLMKARAEDVPVKAIGSLVQQQLNTVMYKQTAGIQSPKDLAGKQIGFSSDSISEEIIYAMVESDGGDPSQVTMIDVGYDLIPALATDNVDALIGGYINHEYLLLQEEGYEMAYTDFSTYNIPESQELIFIASDQTISKRPDTLTKFMNALQKGYTEAANDAQKAVDTLFANEEQDYVLNKAIETQSWNDFLVDYMVADGAFGVLIPEHYQLYANWLHSRGIITHPLSSNDLTWQALQ